MSRIPLRWAPGDRCVVFGDEGTVDVVYPRDGLLGGLVRVRREDGSTITAALGELELVPFANRRTAGGTP